MGTPWSLTSTDADIHTHTLRVKQNLREIEMLEENYQLFSRILAIETKIIAG